MKVDNSGWDAVLSRIKKQKTEKADLDRKISEARESLRESVNWKSDSHIDAAATELAELLDSNNFQIDDKPKFGPGEVVRPSPPDNNTRRWVVCELYDWLGGRDYTYGCRLEGSPDNIGCITFDERGLERA